MEYLAERKIIHENLAASNILLWHSPLNSGNPVPKISNFGSSKIFAANSMSESRSLVPWRWAALEILTTGDNSLNADIWSFGVVFYELVSLGRIPYAELSTDESVLQSLEQGNPLQYPKELTIGYDLS